MPTFVPPDTCMADHKKRRSEALRKIRDETPDDMKGRLAKMKAWFDANSPYSDEERLDNLMRAIFGKDWRKTTTGTRSHQ